MMSKPEGQKNVVLVCASGVTGAVAGLPVAMALKTHWPDCRVTSVISADATQVLERHPAVDTITCDLGFRALKRLFRQQPDGLALFFAASPTSLLAAMASRIPFRTLCDARDVMQSIRELLAGLFRPGWGHDETAALTMLRVLDLPPRLPGRPWVALTPRERRRAHRRLRQVPRPRILVHQSCLSGAMGLLQSKWSLVLAGLGGQDGELGELPQWVERGALDLIRKLTLREWLAVLAESDVLVSADEESLCLADAMGIPTVRLAPALHGEGRSVLPEAVVWQVEGILRHRLRIIRRVDAPGAGVV